MTKFSRRYYDPYASSSLTLRRFVRDRLRLTPRVSWLFRRIAALPDGARVLDVGCGRGGFLELMERENPRIATIGIDLGSPPDYLAQGGMLRGSALSLPFADGSFDVVTCAHVIEHLHDPVACVRELVRVCRPGGAIYIETPSPRAAWMPLFNVFWDDPTHVRPYSRTGLERLLEIAGADVERSGVKTSIPAVLFGLPYLPLGVLLGDRQAKAMFAIYAFGFAVWAGGTAPARG
jgi:2-polyprenyl-3-methyl-5-hydroxy-6-metoxy-1,4-benzoquinol methylase